MALDTYTNLKAAAADWLRRGDITAASSILTDCVSLVEADMNRTLRTIDQEASTAISVASATASLPADYLEMRSAPKINTNPTIALEYKTPEQIEQMGSNTGSPRFYSIRGSNIIFGRPPDGTYTVTIYYFRKIPDLATNSTNNILTKWPMAYLHGILAYSYDYVRNEKESTKHRLLFEKDLAEINKQDKWARYSGAAMAVRVG